MSNLGKWDAWYARLKGDISSASTYGDTVTYALGAKFLEDCPIVEDWGVGTGVFSRYRPDVIGIDGSKTPYADKIVDLVTYRSNVDGIFMRHVLEHNYDWQIILANALASARKICVVLFVPFSRATRVLLDNAKYGADVPDLSLGEDEFYDVLRAGRIKKVTSDAYKTDTSYGQETIFYIVRG